MVVNSRVASMIDLIEFASRPPPIPIAHFPFSISPNQRMLLSKLLKPLLFLRPWSAVRVRGCEGVSLMAECNFHMACGARPKVLSSDTFRPGDASRPLALGECSEPSASARPGLAMKTSAWSANPGCHALPRVQSNTLFPRERGEPCECMAAKSQLSAVEAAGARQECAN